jgi:hypothetical protein
LNEIEREVVNRNAVAVEHSPDGDVGPTIVRVTWGHSDYAIEDRGSERVLRVEGREHRTYYKVSVSSGC